ncbi:hypothetical protein MA20_32015 [Bradyrhizobium japonicum]|uniref:Uncharacterized protein n=1 Tax=Bradyrhizobium japonicum TaxID=375 RepID=A0A0A3XN30_BRAJP|nr:hypothetical protein [Bradyrhizobium japonicum]KGT75817.1 hypothetical protein MA20_32015 [Bradyrhizobium japonicum]
MTSRTKEQNREYMREYMRERRRGIKRDAREANERRPIVPPPARYADLTAAILKDPPIGRRAIDARQLIACHQPEEGS